MKKSHAESVVDPWAKQKLDTLESYLTACHGWMTAPKSDLENEKTATRRILQGAQDFPVSTQKPRLSEIRITSCAVKCGKRHGSLVARQPPYWRTARRNCQHSKLTEKYGAPRETRTPDPLITNQMLFQLSYEGASLI